MPTTRRAGIRTARVAVALIAILLASCSGGSKNEGAPDTDVTSGPSSGAAPATLTALACDPTGSGKVYEVGPGEALASIGEVPWEELVAGDTVRIHWREEPYREKFLLRARGTEEQPIVVCGVAGPSGELPVLDGENAVARSGMAYPFSGSSEPRGLIHVTLGRDDEWGYKPGYLVVQGLHIRNAYRDYTFTDSNGATVSYADNAAGIFVERGEHITVRGVILEGNGNGFFVASGDSEEVLSRDILLERSQIYGNGTTTVDPDRHHNIYTEAAGTVFQFNDIGPLRDGSAGAALKDRSAGTIVRYNRIEGGSRSLDLVEAQDSLPMVGKLPEYRTTLVYGNIIVNPANGASNMVHYGGDSGVPEGYRKGTLYFYNNTIVIRADQEGPNGRWRTAIFDASTADESIDARNNVIVVRAATAGATATEPAWMRSDGRLELGVNWATPGIIEWRDDVESDRAEISGLENVSGDGDGPGFVDEDGNDFRLAAAAEAAGKGSDLHDVPAGLGATVDFEYVHPASGRARTPESAADLGAFAATSEASVSGGQPGAGATPGSNPGNGGNSSGAPGSGPIASGYATKDGWSGPLQYLGKGPNGFDNGERTACTGAGAGSPSVLCVRAGSNGNGTAGAPFGSINAALAAARAGDIIQVAEGTYAENVTVGRYSDPAEITFSLLGGFSSDFSARNAGKYRSVIDGGGKGPAVQLHLQSAGTTVVDGFRITNGRGLGATYDDGNGGGGGVFADLIGNGTLVLSHNEVFGNQTAGLGDDNRGGGIWTDALDWDGSKPMIRVEDNVVHSNQAGRGAGITVNGRTAVILRNVVEANRAHSDHGGGVYVSTASAEVADNVIRGNEIGATVNYGWGGGIFIGGVPAELHGNVITGNYAPGNGSGAFWDEGATGTMREDLVFVNICAADGGSGTGVYVDGGAAPSVVTLDHVTIAGHNCGDGDGAPAAVLVEAGSKLTVRDSILWDNSNEFATLSGASYTVERSISGEKGSGNRADDPQFVDAANGDFRLKPGSPAAGAGANKTNLGAYPK